MKAILSLVIVGLFVGCSGDNPANSKEEIIVGTWEEFHNNEYDEIIEFKADGTIAFPEILQDTGQVEYKWEINGDIMTWTTFNNGELVGRDRARIEIISDDLFVLTIVDEDGTESEDKLTYRRVKSD